MVNELVVGLCRLGALKTDALLYSLAKGLQQTTLGPERKSPYLRKRFPRRLRESKATKMALNRLRLGEVQQFDSSAALQMFETLRVHSPTRFFVDKFTGFETKISRPTVEFENVANAPISRFDFDWVALLGFFPVVGPNQIELENFIGRAVLDSSFDVTSPTDEVGSYKVFEFPAVLIFGKFGQ